MAKDIPIISKSKEKISAIKASEIKDSYFEALKESLSVDFDDLKNTASPLSIKREWGIDFQTQVKFGISLTKRKAIVFLEECGFEISLPMMRKKVSDKSYSVKFRRKISKIGTSHVLTYGEILILVDHKIRP